MKIKETAIAGCYEISPDLFDDQRGRFVKTFNFSRFAEKELGTKYLEDFYSISFKGVIRGLHFQLPPEDGVKLVYCLSGRAFDVVVDLRADSPKYGKYLAFELNSDKCNGIYIPPGLAHGFCAISDNVIMAYKMSKEYAPLKDSGIRWDSVGIDWPVKDPIISKRDQGFEKLSEFRSPFKVGKNG